jgi:hypothetical protein
MKVISYLKSGSKGSAVAEFLIFTLPFFTAFLLLITSIHSKSMAMAESSNLSRQVIRAFITSPNEQLAQQRAFQVLAIYKSKLSIQSRLARPISLEITCRRYPCFSAGNLVTATITIGRDQKSSASEYVDLWR